jgi:hypothetical protein
MANFNVVTAKLQFDDNSPANLERAKPALTLVPAGTGTIPCSILTAVSTATLAATCHNVPAGAYDVGWQLTGEYYTGPTVN